MPGSSLSKWFFVALILGACVPRYHDRFVPAPPNRDGPGPTVRATRVQDRGDSSGSLSDLDCPRARSLAPQDIRLELECLLQRYIRIDTTNPPGNESASAEFLVRVLARDGIDARLVEAQTGRANVVARIAGQNSTRAIALSHHMDVVAAESEEWSVAPFSATVSGSELWGRGALDNKGPGLMQLLAAIVPLRLGRRPLYDVLLLAVADEEAGSTLGSRFLVAEHPEIFQDVFFVLNEGGALLQLGPELTVASVEVAQKAPLWLELSTSGKGGHGSSPDPDAASHRLARALGRLEAFRFPVEVSDPVERMFAERAAAMPPERAAAYAHLEKSLQNPDFAGEFLADPHNRALISNTLSITMLESGDKENVLSASARAVLDVRLLPDQDPKQVIAKLSRVIDDAHVVIKPLLTWQAAKQPDAKEASSFLEDYIHREFPNTPISHNVIGGFTDCNAYRIVGVPCFGFLPMTLSPSAFPLLHGKDERVDLDQLARGVVHLSDLLLGPAAAPAENSEQQP